VIAATAADTSSMIAFLEGAATSPAPPACPCS